MVRFQIADIRLASHAGAMANSDCLQVGDTVQLSGGYSFEPEWLAGAEHVEGSVIDFIPGQNDTPAAVIRLNQALTYKEVTGEIVVLELRYVGGGWSDTGVVHVELCDFVPEPEAWQERRRSKWAENLASYRRQSG